jgi:hypothetical protein
MTRNNHGMPVPEPSQEYKITYKKASGEKVERSVEVRIVYYKGTGFSVRFLDNGKRDCSVVIGVNRRTNRRYWLLLRDTNHQKAEKITDVSWSDGYKMIG